MNDLEQIMRKIHVLFAKCETYGEKKDNKIIVPKKELFHLLEQMNYAVAALQDKYESTTESRERGIKEFARKGEKMIETARKGADDVYAASLVYTDNMIYELADLMTAARQGLRDDYARFVKCIEEQERVLAENQNEIREQLRAMAEGEKYLRLIRKENARLARKEALRNAFFEEGEELEDELEDADWEEYEDDEDLEEAEEDAVEAVEAAEESESEKAESTAEASEQAPAPKPAAKKKRRRPRPEPEDADWEEEPRKVRNIGSAVYQEVGEAYDTPVKKVTYEVRVNQAYFDQLEANVDLDAEYFQWQEEEEAAKNGEAMSEKAAAKETSAKEEKQGKNRRKFGKRKK
ncbi:MAG: hypothetical protein IJY09_01195 [Lachnospiraceae bacterium]|nr:hypothetical protein [Lachnospiraceae bacterium]